MNRYVSEQAFGGQKASLGRDVIIRMRGVSAEDDVVPGKIVYIGEDDVIRVRFFEASAGSHSCLDVVFFETKNPADLESMPHKTWTWPPRV